MAKGFLTYSSLLFRRNDGVTAVEFAFITPVFLLIMMGIIEFSLIMFTTAVMESATSMTSRLGKTGFVAEGSSREEQIIANIQNRTAGLLDPENITITTTVYSSIPNIGQPEPYTDSNENGVYNAGEPYADVNGNGQWDQDMGAAGLGGANDIVVYNVSYPWPIATPLINTIIGSTFTITARSVVKNEPF